MSNTVSRVLALTLALSSVVPLEAANWPQWRGPDGRGVSDERSVPLEWSAETHVAWKAPIPGQGHSQPIVWGDHIFLTAAIEGDVVPGAKAVTHLDEGKEFLHPDSVGAERKHTL
jgi:hypothetical protein